METLLRILKGIEEEIDYETETRLIDDRLLDSFGIVTLVTEVEDAFGIRIQASDILPENFNSMQAIWELIRKRKG